MPALDVSPQRALALRGPAPQSSRATAPIEPVTTTIAQPAARLSATLEARPTATAPIPLPSLAEAALPRRTPMAMPNADGRKMTPAPPPRRPEGQFTTSPAPQQRAETPPQASDPPIGRTAPAPAMRIDDVIADGFEATSVLLGDETIDARRVGDTLLDLALKLIPAEAGSFYVADVNGHELAFLSVRGPKADAIRQSGMTVQVGQGIVGFCAQEGICMVISDIQQHPRFFSGIADAIGDRPRDTLCASAEKEGRLFGAIQLINSQGEGFGPKQMEVLRYIGLSAADLLERVTNET